jgi:hypothetical protein
MIPETFEQWKYCIENNCKIALTKEFAQQRLAVYQSKQHAETQKIIALYGNHHYLNILSWLNKIIHE